MPDIYTDEWYDALFELANSRDDLSAQVPQGEWRAAVEIVGDGVSPYIPEGEIKNFFILLVDGKIKEIKQCSEKIPGKGLNYRITGPASVFDGIAAGVYDPVEKGLDGSLTIKGDMRILLQHAELAPIMIDVYTSSGLTEWPLGIPPYNN